MKIYPTSEQTELFSGSSASPRLCEKLRLPRILSLAEPQRMKNAVYDGGQYDCLKSRVVIIR